MKNFIKKFVKYEPKQYWMKRGKFFLKNNPYESTEYKQQEIEFIQYLNKLEFSSVLEIGCGFGRMSKLILENFPIKRYLGIDISPELIINAQKLSNKFPFAQFESFMIEEFITNEKFDLVFGTEILQHIKSEKIDEISSKLVSLSNRHVINVDTFLEPIPNNLARHNFIHNYGSIYSKNSHTQITHIKKLSVLNHYVFHAEKY